MAWHLPGVQTLTAFVLYLGFACFLTWPAITGLGHIVYGAPGDLWGSMSFYRELVDHHHNPFLPGTISQLSGPEGQPIPWTRDLAAFPSVLLQYLSTAGLGQVAASNLYTLLGYTLSGTVMFLFVRRLTGNPWAALLSGWAFAFYPFALLNGQSHTDYIHGWVLVLGVWRLIELHWRPTRRNAVLAGLAVAFGMWWTPYFILLGGATYVAVLIASAAIAWREHRLRAVLRSQAIAAAMVLVFVALLLSLSTAASGESLGVRTNDLQQFNTYSARPLEYVIPDRRSPLFGGATTSYIARHLHGSNYVESTLYIGITVILLACVAGVTMLRRKLPPGVSRAVIMLFFLALVAIICSAPPESTLLGVTIPFPSHFIMKVTSTWRVYSRFVIVVMLAFSALAGIGLATLARGRGPSVWIALMLAATVLVPLDLWSRLAERTTTVDPPSSLRALARQPRGLTAEYPLTPTGYNFYKDVFFQNVHGMPMINGYLQGTVEERRAVSLENLANPSTAGRLAELGVRYIILEHSPTPYGLQPPGKPGRGFRMITNDSYAAVYVVTAPPAGPALPAAGDGFAEDETASGGATFNWLEQPSGMIALTGTCRGCRGILDMTVGSFARPRVVTVSVGGRVLLVRHVAAPTQLQVPVTFGSNTDVTISATPGPQSIAKTIGGSDPRSVSIQVSDLQYVWPGGRPGAH